MATVGGVRRALGPLVWVAIACGSGDPTVDAEAIRSRCLEMAPEVPESFVLGAAWTEPCGDGICEESLRIESVCVTYQALDADGEIVRLSHGVLTTAGVRDGEDEAEALVDTSLLPATGECDGDLCAGGMLVLQRDGEASTHDYVGAPQAELDGVYDYLEGLRGSLAACVNTETMTLEGGCD